MSNTQPSLNRDNEALIQQLVSTPVGRRWLIKVGLGAAAAAAASHLPSMSRSDAATAWAAGLNQTATTTNAARQDPIATAASQPVPTANRTIQFALGAFMEGFGREPNQPVGATPNLVLVVGGNRIRLVDHTTESRAALRSQGGLWQTADLSAVTHYVPDVPLPADRGSMLSVYGRLGTDDVVVALLMHVPAATTRAMAELATSAPHGLRSMVGSDTRLKTLGLTAANITSPQHVEQLGALGDTQSTAQFLVGLHPNVATKDPTALQSTKDVLGGSTQVHNLGTNISAMQGNGDPLAKLVTVTNPDNTPTQLQFTDPKTGNVTTSTFQTTQMNPGGDPNFGPNLKSAIVAGVKGVRNSGESGLNQVINQPADTFPLGTVLATRVQSQGVTPQPKPYPPPIAAELGGGEVDVTITNQGVSFGIRTENTGPLTSSRTLPIRIYNNWVRWVWAYVQYLGKDGANLSINPASQFPSTKYSESLALVPQVMTVLGAPIWDHNTVDTTLSFPPDAHTARLLFCGLGSNINDGDWRKYFPADAYPDAIAPSSEVMTPGILTGIVCIGLGLWALFTDLQIGLMWKQILDKTVIQTDTIAILIKGAILSGTELVATSLCAGGVTYLEIQENGWGPGANVWGVLEALGTALPKLLFSPGAGVLAIVIANAVLTQAGAKAVVDAIPGFGLAFAVISAVADAATLAEVTAETIAAPWVVENEVSLTYTANITINYDEAEASGWPATAVTWSLQPLIDGGNAQSPTTADMNVGGHVGSDPLVLAVTTPFGGDTIQWSFVVLDDEGHQVGTGVSPKYTNNDPNNPPTTVTFNITELPETVDASTVFERKDTFLYSDSAGASGGYTWSNASGVIETADAAVPDPNAAIQEVTGATVATKAGVVGMVWKQNDRYFLQGIPVDQNTDTLDLVPPTKNGYARPPFLLFDAFVAKQDQGNHVLLEPDDTTDAYFVRSVSLDSTTGAIAWDSSAPALGTFLLPVSAAALHSSGRVITVHTDSGRVGMVHPAATPRPGLATYSAGPGTQIGLLQSPTAVAVTNPGTVIILESGAGQLAAFDLNGNPVKYFGTDPNDLQYTQPLANPGTYLDLAVDGANHIYLLYYTNDGSQPGDYRLDVYNPNGTPLTTLSTGINVPKMAVDFWRSAYGVNFTPLNTPSGLLAVPSISRFDPQ